MNNKTKNMWLKKGRKGNQEVMLSRKMKMKKRYNQKTEMKKWIKKSSWRKIRSAEKSESDDTAYPSFPHHRKNKHAKRPGLKVLTTRTEEANEGRDVR